MPSNKRLRALLPAGTQLNPSCAASLREDTHLCDRPNTRTRQRGMYHLRPAGRHAHTSTRCLRAASATALAVDPIVNRPIGLSESLMHICISHATLLFSRRKALRVTLANVSTQIAQTDFQAAVAAIGKQVARHFQPEWGISATLKAIALSLGDKRAPIQRDADAVIYLGDSSQDPTTGVKGALGYHSANNKNIPYGFVYLDICAKSKEVWTCTLSHEVLELLADPDAAMTVTGPAPRGAPGTVHYDLEVCDPTQGDQYSIDYVVVSNFVGKRYFMLSGGSGKSNYLNLRLHAFGVRPGGYFQYEKGSRAHQIFGSKVTKDQKAAKKEMKNVRRNARRVERLAPGKRRRLS